MSLESIDGPVSCNVDVVSFFMANNDKLVRVDVTRELLQDIERPGAVSDAELEDRCERRRSQFESIAREKYDEEEYTSDKDTSVVRIEKKDL